MLVYTESVTFSNLDHLGYYSSDFIKNVDLVLHLRVLCFIIYSKTCEIFDHAYAYFL